ncbi:TetR/AcrR family transcriptional regulator [Mycetocola spongiae]|uniref:TetR/AcrR family transcriptional regulator n=1 Tax=Mycetocola spongiae TaxID=2859226 RepID=UPI001CF5673A|nr:TetR/AcrR family transcriptional regulator [Mycetocola spongiae]UCR87850.1 TetR/AcrR family transcriptional regulator [Mycetocola spongiae]
MIAEAAAQEFLQHGFAGASLSSIAERIGLTKGALTYHFSAKADFSAHFLELVRSATAQANEFSKAQYPACGVRRLVLYFFVTTSWQLSEPSYAAGLAQLLDQGAPAFESRHPIQDWYRLTVESLQASAEFEPERHGLTPIEAAELFFAMNLGANLFGSYIPQEEGEWRPMRLIRLALTAIGVEHADVIIAEVVDRHRESIPPMTYPRRTHTQR